MINIWPFRKSTCIYKWDDNFAPIIEQFVLTNAFQTYSFTIPPDYYATLTRVVYKVTHAGGVGSFTSQFRIYRGDYQTLPLVFPWANQFTSGSIITYDSSVVMNPALAMSLYWIPIPNHIRLIPGDYMEFAYGSTYGTTVVNPISIHLEAYRF